MQKSKIGKFSIFNSLDVKLEFLTSRVETRQVENMLNSTQVELKMWATQLWIESNSKCQLETRLDNQSKNSEVSEQTNLSSETVFKNVYTFNIQCQSAEIFLLKKKKIE